MCNCIHRTFIQVNIEEVKLLTKIIDDMRKDYIFGDGEQLSIEHFVILNKLQHLNTLMNLGNIDKVQFFYEPK